MPESRLFVRGDEVEIGIDLAASLGAAEDVAADEGKVWQYRDGLWYAWDDEDLGKRAMGYAGSFRDGAKGPTVIKLSANNVRGIVRCCKMHLHQGAFFATAPQGAPFRTQFARIVNGRIGTEPMTRDHRVRADHAPDFDLPADPSPPAVVSQLLLDTWAGCDDLNERIRYFWEWLGAALAGITTRYKDSPLLVGAKDTGKSALLHVIACVFPASSRRSITLHQMSSDYHRAQLAGGRINFVNELPARELLDGEAAKAIMSGEPVSCRHPAERPFSAIMRMGQVFACNELPPSRDRALQERLTILDCPNVVPRAKQDRNLLAKIEAEAPLIANYALCSLQDLLDRGHMDRPPSADGLGAEWRLQGDAVAAWASESLVDTRYEDGEHKKTTAADLYTNFAEWAKRNGHATVSSTRFGIRMAALGFERKRSNGVQWKCTLIDNGNRKKDSSSSSNWWQARDYD